MATDRSAAQLLHPPSLSVLRHYTGLWCLLPAALPVIVTRFGLIPVYDSQRNLLPAYASFFCALALAYVFSQRHRLARAMFSAQLLWIDAAVPSTTRWRLSINVTLAGMMVGALACAVMYVWAFEVGRGSPQFPSLPPTSLNAVVLALSFITLFLLASAACAIVAVREHMQQVLGLSDAEVITGVPRSMKKTPTAAPAAARPGVAVIAGGARLSAFASEEAAGSDAFLSESNQS